MIPRIVLDLMHAAGAVLPGDVEERIRRIASAVNGGLDASSLSPTLKFAIGATPGTVQNAWRETAALIVVPLIGRQNLSDGSGTGPIDVAAAPSFPIAVTVIEWGCATRTTPVGPGNEGSIGCRLQRHSSAVSAVDLETLTNDEMLVLPPDRRVMEVQEVARSVRRKGVSFPFAAGEAPVAAFRNYYGVNNQIAGYVVAKVAHGA